MFTGMSPHTTFATHGVVLLILVIVSAIAALGVYYTSSKAVTQSIRAQEEKIKLASRKVAHAISEGGMAEVKRRPSATPPPTPWLNRVMRLSYERRASKDEPPPKDPNQVTLNDPRPSPVQVKSKSRAKYRVKSRSQAKYRVESRVESRVDSPSPRCVAFESPSPTRAEAILAAAFPALSNP